MPSNLLDCSICLTPFVDPHIIPGCGHTFCLRCIQQIPKRPQVATIFARIQDKTDAACPICRKRFNSALVLPNFSLQHVVAESALHDDDVFDGSSSGFDLTRSSGKPNVAAIYRESGVPPQLAKVLAEEDDSIALRVYILDNSGSMNNPDGQIIAEDGQVHWTTRWEELKHTTKKHAEWNAKLGVPSEFVLLNDQNQSTPIRIDAQKGSTRHQISALSSLLDRKTPERSTPLTECVQTLRQRLRCSAPELQEKDRKLMLILVTDGIPNGTRAAFADAIRGLAREQPVHIVVRLCCNDDGVFGFYDQVDQELELSLDILDDYRGEAKSIFRLNPWFSYPSVLHTVREAGTLSKLLDFIDERALTPMEVGLFAQLFLRSEGQAKYPWQPEALLEAVEKDIAAAPLVFCPRRRGYFPIMDMVALRAALLPGKFSLTGQMASAVGLGGVVEAWYEGRTLLDAFQNPKVTPSPIAEPVCDQEILKLGEVPAGVCFLCARGTDGLFPHCCRTCAQSGGTRHGPTCERRFAMEGYPQALKAVPPASTVAPPTVFEPVFPLGAAVRYYSTNKQQSFPAKVVAFHPDTGLYDLDITGCIKAGVGLEFISAATFFEPVFLPGATVNYYSANKQQSFRAKVVAFHPDTGLYDLDITGCIKVAVKLEFISAIASDNSSGEFALGSQVEYFSERMKTWFPATVKAVHIDTNTYNIDVDGQVRQHVHRDRLRSPQSPGRGRPETLATTIIGPAPAAIGSTFAPIHSSATCTHAMENNPFMEDVPPPPPSSGAIGVSLALVPDIDARNRTVFATCGQSSKGNCTNGNIVLTSCH